ncbi:MAG: hypothetical protein O7G85_08635 [Planctomycetota bacterium]|nr:hypothetical protein [Planctomycetota bacterium]
MPIGKGIGMMVENLERECVGRTTCETADFVLDRIRALGFKLHPESRLMKMRNVLFEDDSPRELDPNDIDFAIALEALRDFLHFGFIFDHFDPSLDGEAKQRLNIALQDCHLPQDNLENSPGRDAQFELFVAAICSRAQFIPVKFAEPDIQVVIPGPEFPEGSQIFGIAAKRIKSVGNFEKNVRKASKQIKKSDLPGVIAIDTSVALNRDNEAIVKPMELDRFRKLHNKGLRRFIDDYYKRIQEWVRTKGVRTIVFHDHQIWAHPEQGWTLMSLYMAVDTSRGNQRRNREYEAFWRSYGRGLPSIR